MTPRTLRHLLALALAVCAVWVLQARAVGVGVALWLNERDFFHTYTPYFPGLEKLQTHEIFSNVSTSKKKIVLLGASAVDSIGCDYTWYRPSPNLEPNAHRSCSVAGQMNRLLHDKNLRDWQVYDLARTGAKLTEMLYVYSQIVSLKPDLVIYGDSFHYYMWDNADADGLNAAQYGIMSRDFGQDPATVDIWNAYLQTLRAHGWNGQAEASAPGAIATAGADTRSPPAAELGDVLARGLLMLRHAAWAEGMPRPLAYTQYRDWTIPPQTYPTFQNPDSGFEYFQGLRLIDLKQREFGGRTFVYFSPQWNLSFEPAYVAGVDHIFGGYLRDHGIPYVSLIGMRMKPITETYDGSHHTLLGNRRIAAALLQNLEKDGLVP